MLGYKQYCFKPFPPNEDINNNVSNLLTSWSTSLGICKHTSLNQDAMLKGLCVQITLNYHLCNPISNSVINLR